MYLELSFVKHDCLRKKSLKNKIYIFFKENLFIYEIFREQNLFTNFFQKETHEITLCCQKTCIFDLCT